MFLLGLTAMITTIVLVTVVLSIGAHLPDQNISSRSGDEKDKDDDRERDRQRRQKREAEQKHKGKKAKSNVTTILPIPEPEKDKEKWKKSKTTLSNISRTHSINNSISNASKRR